MIRHVEGGPLRPLRSGANRGCDKRLLESGLDVAIPILQIKQPLIGPRKVEVSLLKALLSD